MGGEQSGNSIEIDYITKSIDLEGKNINTFTIASYFADSVKYLNLANNQITYLPDGMPKIMLVDLTKNKLGPLLPPQVAKQIVTYSKLKTLCLTNNELEDLNDFLSNKSVESIFLTQNRFKALPINFFERFPQLKTLYLDCNFIETIPSLQAERLTMLTLSLNNIKTLDTSNYCFPQLRALDLSKNQIEKIPKDFSKRFPKLNSLNLNYNLITDIPENDSENEVFPKTLKDIKITNNLIEKVPNSITSLPILAFLNLHRNKLKEIPKLPETIVTLNVSRNMIEKFEEQSLPNLKELIIYSNELTSFPVEIKTEKIETLKAHHNHFTDFDITSLSNTITLIDISFNKIERIPNDFFNVFSNIQEFTACFNQLTELPVEIGNCKCLTTLEISFNPIKNLPKLPRSITTISASKCELTEFNSDGFVEATSEEDVINLKHADFSQNKLESFPEIKSIQYLNLSQNSLKKLPKITYKLKVLDVSMNAIEELPGEVSGNSLIELNLSFNKIEKMPSIQFLPQLKSLDISHNPIVSMLDVTGNLHLDRIDISRTKKVEFVNNSTVKHEVIMSSTKLSKVAPMKKEPILIVQRKGGQKSGYSEIIGLRDEMEDAIIVRDDLFLYAVCDGHAGFDTSNFASIQLPHLFEFYKNQITYEKVGDLILNIFDDMEKELKKMRFDDGSTLCLCLLCKDSAGIQKVVTAHLGDARALIALKDGRSKELTIDHKPSNRKEFERIHNQFGRLSSKNRIDGSLAVSRSIGDYSVFAVGRDVELNGFDVGEDDKYLIIGCDGVFDVLTNEEVALVASKASSPYEAAFLVRNAAYGCGSTDNISVIVVDLTIE